jgi:hypothetical protein
MTFGAVGLASDAFLQMVKHETHRGLEGRAPAGFHRGGRCHGYKTELAIISNALWRRQ